MNITSRATSTALKNCLNNNFKVSSSNYSIKELAEMAEIRPEHLSKYLNKKIEISFEKGLEIATKWNLERMFCSQFIQQMRWEMNFVDGTW